jgi:hypothetical protein
MEVFHYRSDYKVVLFSLSLLGCLSLILGQHVWQRCFGAAIGLMFFCFLLDQLFAVIMLSEEALRYKSLLRDKKVLWREVQTVKEICYTTKRYRAVSVDGIRIDCRIQELNDVFVRIQAYSPAPINGNGTWKKAAKGIDLRLVFFGIMAVWLYLVFALFLGL